jgi:hypothetical protein
LDLDVAIRRRFDKCIRASTGVGARIVPGPHASALEVALEMSDILAFTVTICGRYPSVYQAGR